MSTIDYIISILKINILIIIMFIYYCYIKLIFRYYIIFVIPFL